MMHGGKSRKGEDHPAFKTGEHVRDEASRRYEAVLSPETLTRLEELAGDPEQLSLRRDIGYLDLRVEGLLERAMEGESPQAWKEAGKVLEEALTAREAEDEKAEGEALQRLAAILKDGTEREQALEKADDLIFTKRVKLVDSEHRRRTEHAQMIATARVLRLLQLVAASITRNVKDPFVIETIRTDIRRLATGTVGAIPPGGSEEPDNAERGH